MRSRRKEMAQTGNKPLTVPPLTEFEQKIVGLLGSDYLDGSQICPDSLPEQEVTIELCADSIQFYNGHFVCFFCF